jgi:hypothetical protein
VNVAGLIAPRRLPAIRKKNPQPVTDGQTAVGNTIVERDRSFFAAGILIAEYRIRGDGVRALPRAAP